MTAEKAKNGGGGGAAPGQQLHPPRGGGGYGTHGVSHASYASHMSHHTPRDAESHHGEPCSARGLARDDTASSISAFRSPLSHCSDGPAVMTSLGTLARLGHVRPDDLRSALARTHHADAERVEVTKVSDGLLVQELGSGSFDSHATQTQGLALAVQGRRCVRGDPFSLTPHMGTLATESTSLLSGAMPLRGGATSHLQAAHGGVPLGSVSMASAVSISTLRSDFGSPVSQVRIKAHMTPRNAVCMIPNARNETTTVLLLDADEPELPRSPLERALPAVIKEVKEIGVYEENGEGFSYIVIEYARPVIIWLILIAAVVGLASKAVVAEAMYPVEVSAIAKSIWMNAISLVFFVALAATELRTAGLRGQVKELLYAKSASMLPVYLLGGEEKPQLQQSRTMVPCFGLQMIIIAAVLHGLFSVFFLLSLEYTTLENCVVLMNLHPILVLIPRLARTRLSERTGALLVGLGTASLMYTSPARAGASSPMFGNLLAFMVSVFMWLYLSLSQHLQAALPSGILMTIIVAGSLLVQIFQYSSLASPEDRLFTGMGQYFLPNFLGGFFGGFMAYGGFMLAGRYLNPLVVSVNITLEPIYSVVLQLLYVHIYPPALVWLSLLILVVGAIICALGGKNEKENVILTDREDLMMVKDVLEDATMMT